MAVAGEVLCGGPGPFVEAEGGDGTLPRGLDRGFHVGGDFSSGERPVVDPHLVDTALEVGGEFGRTTDLEIALRCSPARSAGRSATSSPLT